MIAPERIARIPEGLREVLSAEDLIAIPVAGAEDVDRAYAIAAHAVMPGGEERVRIVERAGQMVRSQRVKLMAMMALELGVPMGDALSDVRDAANLCLEFAALGRRHFVTPETLAGPTGETNRLHLVGRGTIACLSVHPSSIAPLIGQVAAAFVAGNCVIVKPANEVSALAIRILLRAGIPGAALAFLPGEWDPVGAALIADRRCAGVAFAGPQEIASAINRALAQRDGPLVPLITGIVPHAWYLMRFVNERTVTVNTTAAGGNTSLMTGLE